MADLCRDIAVVALFPHRLEVGNIVELPLARNEKLVVRDQPTLVLHVCVDRVSSQRGD
jgi:hypothetical protein